MSFKVTVGERYERIGDGEDTFMVVKIKDNNNEALIEWQEEGDGSGWGVLLISTILEKFQPVKEKTDPEQPYLPEYRRIKITLDKCSNYLGAPFPDDAEIFYGLNWWLARPEFAGFEYENGKVLPGTVIYKTSPHFKGIDSFFVTGRDLSNKAFTVERPVYVIIKERQDASHATQ